MSVEEDVANDGEVGLSAGDFGNPACGEFGAERIAQRRFGSWREHLPLLGGCERVGLVFPERRRVVVVGRDGDGRARGKRAGSGQGGEFEGDGFHGDGCEGLVPKQSEHAPPPHGFLSDLSPIDGGHGFPAIISPMKSRAAAAALAAATLCATLRAQDLEPRAYSNSPTGLSFAIAGYAYVKGTVLTDPSLPLENVSNEAHVGVFAYATTLNVLGKSAKFDMIVPYTSLAAKGLVFGLPRERYVTGFADPAFRFSMNFIGAPALTAAEFKDYRQDFILGASLRVTAPLGQYNYDKLVNIGTNRWSFKPEIGLSKAFGRMDGRAHARRHFLHGQRRLLRRPDARGGAADRRAGRRHLLLRARRLAGAECGLFRGRKDDRR